MLTYFVVMYPGATLAGTVAALAVAAFLVANPSRNLIRLAMLVVLLPLWPVLVIRLIAQWVVDGCDYLTVNAAWCKPFVAAARYLETKL